MWIQHRKKGGSISKSPPLLIRLTITSITRFVDLALIQHRKGSKFVPISTDFVMRIASHRNLYFYSSLKFYSRIFLASARETCSAPQAPSGSSAVIISDSLLLVYSSTGCRVHISIPSTDCRVHISIPNTDCRVNLSHCKYPDQEHNFVWAMARNIVWPLRA